MKILLLNAGSSSLKVALLESEGGALLAQASADWAGRVTRYAFRAVAGDRPETREVAWLGHAEAARHALDDLGLARPGATPAAVGHRIVHGGEFQRSVRIGPAVRARIAALAELAPLHNPPGLETLAAAEAVLPERAARRGVRHGLPRDAAPAAAHLPAAGDVDARLGHSPLRVPRPEPRLLCAARRGAAGPASRLAAPRDLPPRPRLLGDSGARRALRSTRRWASRRSTA